MREVWWESLWLSSRLRVRHFLRVEGRPWFGRMRRDGGKTCGGGVTDGHGLMYLNRVASYVLPLLLACLLLLWGRRHWRCDYCMRRCR